LGYEVQWIELPSSILKATLRLNIIFGTIKVGTTEKMEWCQWSEYNFDELWFDTDVERERIRKLNATKILLFEYRPSSLPQIAAFLTPILSKFGGWVDCKGDGLSLYTVQTIDQIVLGCP
jgi:hypothetical protein